MKNPTEHGLVPSFTKLLLPLSIGLAVSAGAYAQPENPDSYLEEITVTATKRSESLQEVSMSISAIGGDSLERLGVANFDDIATSVPSLSMRSSGPGRTKLNIRGISAATGVAPTVSFYLDEMPVSSISSGSSTSFAQAVISPKLFDLERVEVLRGPQGTLYGSSSMGGTIRLITRQPNLTEQEGKVNLEVSSTNGGGINGQINGMVNTPLGDATAVRIIASVTDNEGHFDRVSRDTGAKFADNVNNEDTKSIRVALRHEFDEGNAYIQPYVFHQKIKMDGKPNYDGPGSNETQRRFYDAAEPFDDEFTMYNLTYGHDFEALSFVLSASQIKRELANVEDVTDGAFFNIEVPAGNATPYGDFSAQNAPGFADETIDLEDTTVEARLSYDGGEALTWIAGVFHKDAEADSGYRMQRGLGYKLEIANGLANTQDLKNYKETAVFGELSYELTEKFGLTLGARALEYKYSQFKEDWGWAFLGDNSLATPSDRANANALNLNLKDEDVSGKVTATYNVDDDSQLYATVSTGSRPGGGNRTIPRSSSTTIGIACDAFYNSIGITGDASSFAGDSVLNRELGWKTHIGENIRFNGAAYYMTWKDIQQSISAPSACGVNITGNLGKAESRGFELEMTAALSENVTINAGFGWTEAKLKESIPSLGIKDGDKLADVPEKTFNLDLDYVIPQNSGEYFAIASYSYVDDTLEITGQANTDVLGSGINSGNVKPSYSLVNLRAGYQSSNNWEAVAFVNNVTDKEAIYGYSDTLAFMIDGYDRTVRNTPRTVGVSMTYSF